MERLYPLAYFALALFAFAFNWATGHRGIFLLDQSMVFDGGWRIIQGETPYKDFLIPFGPITFYIQALFFRVFGVNWSATVLSACALNVLATLSAVRIVRLLSGGSRVLAMCSGLATAICFQAPFGTLWFEQTAMFFDLLALQAVVESFRTAGGRRALWLVASGVSLTLAVLSKQNYGVFFIPVVISVLLAHELPSIRRAWRSLSFLVVGGAAGGAVFLLWLWLYSDVDSFVRRVLVVAGSIGRERLTVWTLAPAFTFDAFQNAVQIDLIGVFSTILVVWLWGMGFREPVLREMSPACAAATLLPWYRSFTQATTMNDWQNNLAFTGLAACLGIAIISRVLKSFSITPTAAREASIRVASSGASRICLFVLIGLWGAAFLWLESREAWRRIVQEFPATTAFRESVQVHGLERVLWGEPTMVKRGKGPILQKADFEELAAYLLKRGDRFFVMGDATILYGLLRVPSPQPMLYFLPGHSFLTSEIPQLDETVSTALEQNGIAVVIREKETCLNEVRDAYPLLPRTWAWFNKNFIHVTDYGNYEVWERRHDSLP